MTLSIMIIILLACIAAGSIFWGYSRTKQTNEYNYELEKQKQTLENKLKILDYQIKQQNNQIKDNKILIQDMQQTSKEAFSNYSDLLMQQYEEIDKNYDNKIIQVQEQYRNKEDILKEEIAAVQQELDKMKETRAAAIQSLLKEQEVKDKISFFCPQISENELKDIRLLRDIEYKLSNPRVLRMLIWQNYFQKPINQVCANILGSSSALKTGIYKITNQLDGKIYIGQAVDIATRIKNHAKAGLGIDTPANNKLYIAMMRDGLENFSFEVVEECQPPHLNEKERFYIDLYKSNEFGYNSNAGIQKS